MSSFSKNDDDDDGTDDDFNLFLLLSAQQQLQKNAILDLVCQPCWNDNSKGVLFSDLHTFPFCQLCTEDMNIMREPKGINASVLAIAKPVVDAFGASFHPSIVEAVETSFESVSNEILPTPWNDANIPLSTKIDKNPRQCMGHKERILGSAFSECGAYLATASQDSTVKIWNVDTNQLLSTITLDKEYEVLRVAWAKAKWAQELGWHVTRGKEITDSIEATDAKRFILATGGADGVVHLFRTENPEEQMGWTSFVTINHSLYYHNLKNLAPEPDDKPQIYSLQFLYSPFHSVDTSEDNSAGGFLLTSSDDHLHVWKISERNKKLKRSDDSSFYQFKCDEVFSVCFSLDSTNLNETCTRSSVQVYRMTGVQKSSSPYVEQLTVAEKAIIEEPVGIEHTDGPTFGGDRNPMNLIYVFDASYCSENRLIGVALSDGTFRILDDYGNLLSTLRSSDTFSSHLTSFSWHSGGEKIIACTADGTLIVWTIEINEKNKQSNQNQANVTLARCMICRGGSDIRRAPLFGAVYLNVMCTRPDHNHCTNRCWGPNTPVLSWSADGKLCLWDVDHDTLISELRYDANYPIYSVSIHIGETKEGNKLTFAVAGGGTNPGVIGTPAYLYSVFIRHVE
jgi:WD40 repeat protein